MTLLASVGQAAVVDPGTTYAQHATQIAGAQSTHTAAVLCGTVQERREKFHWPTMDPESAPMVPATKVFDQLYYVGTDSTNLWLLNTPEGIVLFDSLFSDQTVQSIILPSLRQLHLDPAMVKYVVVLHAHVDHYGGARYFQKTYGAKVIMSANDWNYLQGVGYSSPQPEPRPSRDIAAADGQELSLAGVKVQLILTPGHTPGAMAAIVPVTDHGKPHTAVLLSGLAIGTISLPDLYPASISHIKSVALARKVDVALTAHPVVDDAIARLREIQDGLGDKPNPFVRGVGGVQNFLSVVQDCALASIARGASTERGPARPSAAGVSSEMPGGKQ